MSQTSGSFGVGSFSSNDSTKSFDIHVEKDVIALLRQLHRSTLNQDAKNQLRDLVFAYVQNPDNKKLSDMAEIFGRFGFSIAVDASTASSMVATAPRSEVKKPQLGRFRPAPQFTPATVQETNPVKLRVIPDAPPVTEVVEERQQVRAEESVKEVEPEIQTPPTPPEPVSFTPAEPPTPAPSQSSVAENSNPAERIKEIKRIINQKVGNPVSLIDAHNEIGREYMNALLDAMKNINGGSPDAVATAMNRLEKSFAQVQALDLEAPPQPEQTQQPEQKEAVTVEEPVVAPEVTPQVPPIPEPVAPQSEVTVDEPEAVQPMQSVAQHMPDAPVEESVAEPVALTQEPVTPVPPPPNPIPTQTTAPTASPTTITSVRKEKQIQDLMQSNRIKEVQEQKEAEEKKLASTDPLFVPDVSSGLQQLLSEWNLFKSSGIFGTGPSGTDHPLYKKLGPLTMAAVIAGRFEGATPQIKQSITDYMNGWRYEEGVVHEHAETFEHYLRRVIKHILDKQKAGV